MASHRLTGTQVPDLGWAGGARPERQGGPLPGPADGAREGRGAPHLARLRSNGQRVRHPPCARRLVRVRRQRLVLRQVLLGILPGPRGLPASSLLMSPPSTPPPSSRLPASRTAPRPSRTRPPSSVAWRGARSLAKTRPSSEPTSALPTWARRRRSAAPATASPPTSSAAPSRRSKAARGRRRRRGRPSCARSSPS